MIDRQGTELTLRRQCEFLGLAPSSLYYRPVGESPYNLVMHTIDRLYTERPFFWTYIA